MLFKRTVANASGNPGQAMQWISRVETASSWQELEEHEGFHTLNNKFATAKQQQQH